MESTSRTSLASHRARICWNTELALASEISHCERDGTASIPACTRLPFGSRLAAEWKLSCDSREKL
jgi:hypothetical protein